MADALLPAEVLENVNDVDKALNKVEEELGIVLKLCTREAMDNVTYLERASTFLTLSKTLNTLFCLYLRTGGLSPDDHHVKSELERVDLYQEKVQAAVERNTGPRRPTTNLNVGAANRFIEHAIPDLAEEQRRQIREISKQANLKRQKEKSPMPIAPKRRASGLSIAEEAANFLAEATKELQTFSVETAVRK